MSKKLSEQEKRNRQLLREEKRLEKEMNPELDERCYEILRILREAPNHPAVKYNSIYFENHFQVSNVTILRAIRTLKDMDLIEEKQQNGSYVIKKEVEQLYSKETLQNLAIIASVKGLLQQYKNTPLFDKISKMIYFLEPKVAKGDTALSPSRIAVPPQIEYDIDIRKWDKLCEAMAENKKVLFRYTKSYTNTEIERTIWPYQLLLDNGSVYLFGHSEYYDVDVLYDINFIADLKISNENFELPEDFDFTSRCAGGRLGAFTGYEVEKYKIRFTGYAKEWIKHHKWANDQVFTEDEDSTTITFSSSQFEKVFQLVLGWGINAEPLEPKGFVNRWKEEIRGMWEKIQN